MTEQELRDCNPWKEVADKYDFQTMLYSLKEDQVCAADKEMIEAFNRTAEPIYRYHLNVPVYPWYGNPLTAKVIVLSLNPGYVERESIVAKMMQMLPIDLLEGYVLHLRDMLKFECCSFLPDESSCDSGRINCQDLANIHNSWYWKDRLIAGFVNDNTGLKFDVINGKFAVIEYIGYSSEKFQPFKRNKLLPSQLYTRKLIQYIVSNNKDTIFIVSRNVKIWKDFLGDIWDDNRFIVSSDYLGQRFTPKILKDNYQKVISAFKM